MHCCPLGEGYGAGSGRGVASTKSTEKPSEDWERAIRWIPELPANLGGARLEVRESGAKGSIVDLLST